MVLLTCTYRSVVQLSESLALRLKVENSTVTGWGVYPKYISVER